MLMNKVDLLLRLAQQEAISQPGFFTVQGPGSGDRATAAFISALRSRASQSFGADFAECAVIPATGIRVDYWFPDERVIVEVALGLRNPLSEFERDILKAVISRSAGLPVEALVLLGKPGALRRTEGPWYKRVMAWAASEGINVSVHELRPETAA